MTTSYPASTNPPCELCGGQMIGGFRMIAHSHIGIHPHVRRLWSRPQSSLNGLVCLWCGYTKLFAADLAEVREEARQHPERFTW